MIKIRTEREAEPRIRCARSIPTFIGFPPATMPPLIPIQGNADGYLPRQLDILNSAGRRQCAGTDSPGSSRHTRQNSTSWAAMGGEEFLVVLQTRSLSCSRGYRAVRCAVAEEFSRLTRRSCRTYMCNPITITTSSILVSDRYRVRDRCSKNHTTCTNS